MNILLVGGFFGSGKTTVISRLTDQMLAAGQSLCIIENEIGKNSIDDLLLQRGSVEISTITGGCVCCQVTGSLIEAVQDLNRQFSPDWIIVELTGIAYLKDLRKKLEKYLPDHPAIISLSVVDAPLERTFKSRLHHHGKPDQRRRYYRHQQSGSASGNTENMRRYSKDRYTSPDFVSVRPVQFLS